MVGRKRKNPFRIDTFRKDGTLIIYAHRNFYEIFIAWCHVKGLSKSEGGEAIIKDFLTGKFKPKELSQFTDHYKKMTPQQRKHPNNLEDELVLL